MVEDFSQTVHISPPLILCLISKLGKRSELVFLSLVPNTTKSLQIYYGRKLWDLKHPKIPHTFNGRIRNLILTCYSSLHNSGQFLALN